MQFVNRLLTQVFACREAKRHPLHKSLCGVGIVVTNALSERLIVETVEGGWLWRQQFSRGQPLEPVSRQSPQSKTCQQFTFLPDRSFFGDRRLSYDGFIEWFRKQPREGLPAQLTLTDLTTGRSQDLN